jgi:hypothetical protein
MAIKNKYRRGQSRKKCQEIETDVIEETKRNN